MSWSTASYGIWAVLGLTFVAAEVAGARLGRTDRIGTIIETMAAHPVLRGAIVLAWMWLGWHAFAR